MQAVWKRAIMLVGLLWVDLLFAEKSELPTVGEIANKLIIGTDFVTKFVLVVCIVVGAILIVTSVTYFRGHYHNPKMVPLDRPIIYLILGLALFFIPFLGEIFVPTTSTIDMKKKEEKAAAAYSIDIDAPLELGNEYDH